MTDNIDTIPKCPHCGEIYHKLWDELPSEDLIALLTMITCLKCGRPYVFSFGWSTKDKTTMPCVVFDRAISKEERKCVEDYLWKQLRPSKVKMKIIDKLNEIMSKKYKSTFLAIITGLAIIILISLIFSN